jgi:hypothetical protein
MGSRPRTPVCDTDPPSGGTPSPFGQRFMKATLVSLLLVSCGFVQGAQPASSTVPHAAAQPGSRLVKLHGVPSLEVDGAPFLLLGAQCDIWRSTRQDDQTLAFFDGYKAMHATAVSVGIPWSKTETARDHYDFRFLDWFIARARERGLKLVVNLFNSNVCGKVRETPGTALDPGYTPPYVIQAPGDYQRMVLPGPWKYDFNGPPMCPNDPRTRERERLLCVLVAGHLAQADLDRTVILLQIDNEFYYQQWVGTRPPDEKSIRCHCQFCEAKWQAGTWKDGEDFMFHSFADYARVLTDAITDTYPLPLYLNSPWWPPHVIPIFLDRCPNLAFIGIDGVMAPNEPNMLTRSQVGRNLPFAAENPTEEAKTRLNLDVLPYYSLIGQQGIGNLLWECGRPHTVVEDPDARRRYGAALYPLHWAQSPIARNRGTENLIGWYLIRDLAPNLTTDPFGNYVSAKEGASVVQRSRLFVREGAQSRLVDATRFTTSLGDLRLDVSEAAAGIITRIAPNQVVLAVPQGHVAVTGPRTVQATEGRFERDRWLPERTFAVQANGPATVLEIREPKVILLKY